jgi:nicotinamide-nucleotide amidase
VEATSAELIDLAARVHQLLARRGETLATAESLTGGLLGAVLTAVAGASATYRGGVVVYATDLKVTMAGVPPDLLADRGPVDADVATAMAEGARDRLGASWGVALTGVAGPEPQGGCPAGTVFAAVSGAGSTTVDRHMFRGDRAAVRLAACRKALLATCERLADGE